MKHLAILILVSFSLFVTPQITKAQSNKKVAGKSISSNLQKFKKPNFLFSKDAYYYTADSKNYIVYEVKGYSQKALYNKVLLGISKLFKNPEKVISKFENEFITINGYNGDCVKYSTLWFSYTYSIKIQFRDGKIRVDAPIITGSGSGDIRSNTAGWIKTQNNYNEVKPYFESSMNDLIMLFLNNSFFQNDDW